MAGIGSCMSRLLEEYTHFRGSGHHSGGGRVGGHDGHHHRPFWDCVVITALDEAQCRAFQQQVEDKRNRGELPVWLPVHVIPDPPGVRIGNGGSTLTVVEFLDAEYGLDLEDMKIFLVHAGGWSQRIPSAAVLGKIFSLLPYGDPPFQMLDLKLALSWPFVEKVGPGIFLGSGDDFSIRDLGENLSHICPAPRQGFTALGHPSPISLGRSHGVYVVENPESLDLTQHIVRARCLEVLQKPNDERMRSQKAVLPGKTHTFANGIQMDGEVVYTDSCYFFGTDVVRKLLDLKKSIGTLTCEIDAFGDILQGVGENATCDYVYNTSNISVVTDSLLDTRKTVFEALKGTDIHLFLLNASAYIHIGTTKELLHYFCRDCDFQGKMNFQKEVFTNWISGDDHENGRKRSLQESDFSQETAKEVTDSSKNLSKYACVVHSSLHGGTKIGADTFVECCDFEVPVDIIGNSIISNCKLSYSNVDGVTIPENTFLHTIPISTASSRSKADGITDLINENSTKMSNVEFVTVVMNIDDNLKKSVTVEEAGDLPFNQRDINQYLLQRSLTLLDILPDKFKDDQVTRHTCSSDTCVQGTKTGNNTVPDKTGPEECKTDAGKKISLWNLKLYPAFTSMTSSFLDAIHIKTGQKSKNNNNLKPLVFYSLSELLKVKDVTAMLNFRQALYDKIKQGSRYS